LQSSTIVQTLVRFHHATRRFKVVAVILARLGVPVAGGKNSRAEVVFEEGLALGRFAVGKNRHGRVADYRHIDHQVQMLRGKSGA